MDDSHGRGADTWLPTHPSEARAHERRVQVPLEVLGSVARRLAAGAEPVLAAASPLPTPDAGPASAAVDALLGDVDAALAGLADRLAAAGAAMRATAEDLADTDARTALRLLGGDPGALFAPSEGR